MINFKKHPDDLTYKISIMPNRLSIFKFLPDGTLLLLAEELNRELFIKWIHLLRHPINTQEDFMFKKRKPFNLARALAGDPVVNGEDKKIVEIHFFRNVKSEFPVAAVVEGENRIDTHTIYGQFDMGGQSKFDLFMAPK